MTDRELAVEILRICERLILDSMTKNGTLARLLAMKPKLSDGKTLTDNYLDLVRTSAREDAWKTIHRPFEQLIQSLAGGSDPKEILRTLQELVGKQ